MILLSSKEKALEGHRISCYWPVKLMKPCRTRITSYWNSTSAFYSVALMMTTSNSSSVLRLGNLSTSLKMSMMCSMLSEYLRVCA